MLVGRRLPDIPLLWVARQSRMHPAKGTGATCGKKKEKKLEKNAKTDRCPATLTTSLNRSKGDGIWRQI